MLVRFLFGPYKGEIKHVPVVSGRAMLADGRAEPADAEPAPADRVGTAAVQAPPIQTRDPIIPSGRHRRGRR